MTRVIVHAGFHKTGTTSLQLYLGQNRRLFRPWFDFYGQGDQLHRSAVAARIFAKKPFPWRFRAFRMALRADLAALEPAGLIVLSREHFSGVMPGHRRWTGRRIRRFSPAAAPLGRVLVDEIRRRFGPDTRVELLYTTRAGDDWARSVHGHLLRSLALTEDFGAFRARLPREIDLAAEARRIAARAKPDALHIRALEDYAQDRLGPARALLDLAGVPPDRRAALPDAERHNRGDDAETRAHHLARNRREG